MIRLFKRYRGFLALLWVGCVVTLACEPDTLPKKSILQVKSDYHNPVSAFNGEIKEIIQVNGTFNDYLEIERKLMIIHQISHDSL